MTHAAVFHDSLENLVASIPEASIVSRTVYDGEGVKATIFGFAAGQELTEHTAAQPAVLHILRGRADLILGDQRHQAEPGAWAYLPAHLPHTVRAQGELVLLLLLLR